ncbi:hypothetical protein [Streptomyces sp. NPDC093089]|uniref:hypothetical protein n=1 Tax=Streptomyces sp. NPDC093089 TaxID=3366024 RepID=UPI0037F5BBD1
MSDTGKVVRLYAKGAPVGVEGGVLVGFPADRGRAGEWLVTREADGFRFTAKGTEETIAAEGTGRAPAAVRPDASPASVWRIQRLDADGATTVISLADLRTGTYVIDQHGLPLGRDLFEDRSPLPKPVLVRTDDRDPRWTIEVLA